jgi:hypothetical protein
MHLTDLNYVLLGFLFYLHEWALNLLILSGRWFDTYQAIKTIGGIFGRHRHHLRS